MGSEMCIRDRLSNCHIICSDLFEQLDKRYDFILTNPPYLKSSLDRADEEVKKHEPKLALSGGQDGLDLINKIITASPAYLLPGGQLWLEHEPEQTDTVRDRGSQAGFKTTTFKDQYGVRRYSVLVSL